MQKSYALVALFLIYFFYMISKYATLYTDNTDSQGSLSQFNGTPIFVALIQRVNSSSTNIKLVRESWLKGIDNYVFSEKEGTWSSHSRRIRLPPSIRKDVTQIRWISAYVNFIIKSQAEWFLIAPDDSYVIMENLMALVPKLPDNKPAYASVSSTIKRKFHMLLLNRSALKFLSKAYSLNICPSHGLLNLENCLARLGQAEKFDIERDSIGRNRFLVQYRHMVYNEFPITSRKGPYTDRKEDFESLSDKAHSFLNLHSNEIIWYHALTRGLKH